MMLHSYGEQEGGGLLRFSHNFEKAHLIWSLLLKPVLFTHSENVFMWLELAIMQVSLMGQRLYVAQCVSCTCAVEVMHFPLFDGIQFLFSVLLNIHD